MRKRLFTTLLLLLLPLTACSMPLSEHSEPVPTRDLPTETAESRLPSPTPAPTETPAAGFDPDMVIMGDDGNIYLATLDGDSQALTTDASDTLSYQFPTLSRDGRWLAFVAITGGGDTLHIIDLQTGEDFTPYISTNEPVIYAYWSPDNLTLTLLTRNATNPSLLLKRIHAPDGEPQIVDRGPSYYWSFSPDGNQFLYHAGSNTSTGGSLGLFALDRPDPQETKFEGSAGDFQAPAWGSSGETLYSVLGDRIGHSTLIRTDTDGERAQELFTTFGRIMFTPAPGEEHIAVLPEAHFADTFFFGQLSILDHDGSVTFASPEGGVFAYFWSPDGSKLAYFTYRPISDEVQGSAGKAPYLRPQTQQRRMDVYIVDAASGERTALAQFFQPADGFQRVLYFADQYQHSDTIWSPDSSQLVLAGQPIVGPAGIWIYRVADPSDPLFIQPGKLAFWAWQ